MLPAQVTNELSHTCFFDFPCRSHDFWNPLHLHFTKKMALSLLVGKSCNLDLVWLTWADLTSTRDVATSQQSKEQDLKCWNAKSTALGTRDDVAGSGGRPQLNAKRAALTLRAVVYIRYMHACTQVAKSHKASKMFSSNPVIKWAAGACCIKCSV